MGTRSDRTGGGEGRLGINEKAGQAANPARPGRPLSRNEAEAAISRLAPAGPGEVASGFRAAAGDAVSATERAAGEAGLVGASSRQVQLASLTALTDAVPASAVERALTNPRGTGSASGSNALDTPRVIRVRGRNYIISGLADLVAARLRGQRSARVKFYNLDDNLGSANV